MRIPLIGLLLFLPAMAMTQNAIPQNPGARNFRMPQDTIRPSPPSRDSQDSTMQDHKFVDLRSVTVTSSAAAGVGSFHALSRIDLNLLPVRSAQDLLRLVPGLFIAQHQGGGKAEQIFLRGF